MFVDIGTIESTGLKVIRHMFVTERVTSIGELNLQV